MKTEERTLKYRGKEKTVNTLVPETLPEAIGLAGHEDSFKYICKGIEEATRRAAFGVKKKPRVVKINLSSLSEEQLETLRASGILTSAPRPAGTKSP
jgi:hypothetical protein